MPPVPPTHAPVEPIPALVDEARCSAEFAHLGVSGLSADESPDDFEDALWVACHVCRGFGVVEGLTATRTCGLCGGNGVLHQE